MLEYWRCHEVLLKMEWITPSQGWIVLHREFTTVCFWNTKSLPNSSTCSSAKKVMRVQMVLKPQHAYICPKSHFPQAVCMEVELIFHHIIVMLFNSQILLQCLPHHALSEITVTRCQLIPAPKIPKGHWPFCFSAQITWLDPTALLWSFSHTFHHHKTHDQPQSSVHFKLNKMNCKGF